MSLIDDTADLKSALSRLLEQVHQMEGMFPDDPALEGAIHDAELALYGESDRTGDHQREGAEA